jgi:carbon monoxide dehydrogenase subunit G
MQRRFAAWAIALAASSAAAGATAATIAVERDGERFHVRASAEIQADPRTAWETITDYEKLREFVPDVEHSRVIARNGGRLVVEHRGAFHLLFIEIPVRVRLAVQHEPYERVVARSQAGMVGGEPQTLRDFAGTYVLTVVGRDRRAGVRLDYESRFELAEPLPPILGQLFGTAMVQRGMRQQFEAMVREIERRQAARPSIEKSG